MSSRHTGATRIRRGRWEDLDAILDLLTEYGLPREHFAPFYTNDPTYRPEQSWLVERDGRLAAHLRVFDRWIYAGGTRLRIAGVGNVITAQAYRGRGYAGQLLTAMLAAATEEGFAYSLLWTHLPALYARYGWVSLPEERVHASLPPAEPCAVAIAPFRDDDLPAVMQLYEATNAARAGPTVRTPAYWRGQLAWLGEDRQGFLVARAAGGELVGYARSRPGAEGVELLELGLAPDQFAVGRALLAALPAGPGRRLEGRLPPSLRPVFRPGECTVITDPSLMGRTVHLAALVRALEPVWRARLARAGLAEGTLQLATSAGHATVRLSAEGVAIEPLPVEAMPLALDETTFGHLLFRGFDAAASARLAVRPDAALLQVLFPPQDFVIWPSDAF
ncbi:MAG TPA: GNAT family N-acetyltransferase [Chloroflexota bacterium]|nr:GNAT family N-acetyltransferase [Chloroflexota bacterium]